MRTMRLLIFGVLVFLFNTGSALIGGTDEIKLIYAEGRIYYHEIFVMWSTEYEQTPCEFLIEASTDGKDWRIRGHKKSKGKKDAISEYKFVDQKVGKWKFYRIKRVGKGGQEVLKTFELEDYSIEVDLEALQFPGSRRLVLEYSIDKDQELMIRIYNRIGEQVMTKIMPFDQAGDYIFHLDISDLKKDSYLLQINQVVLDKTVAEHSFKVQ